MSEGFTLVGSPHRPLGARVLGSCMTLAVRASLLVSPRPAALLLLKAFASSGAKVAEALNRHAPANVVARANERYGEQADMLLDVFRPSSPCGALRVLLWIHGGAFVGGSKDELSGYLLIANSGYAVVAPRYSLAPEHRYPTPVSQVMEALRYVEACVEPLRLDPDRIVIGGDSAGAQIAAQIAALVTKFDLDTEAGQLFLENTARVPRAPARLSSAARKVRLRDRRERC